MRVGIVGSRDYYDLGRVERFVRKLAAKYPGALVVSGGCRGVDSAAEQAARDCGLGVISYRPIEFEQIAELGGGKVWSIETIATDGPANDWVAAKSYRINPPVFRNFTAAAHCRNVWITESAEQLVAFWDGRSTGTKFTLDSYRARGLEPVIYGEDS